MCKKLLLSLVLLGAAWGSVAQASQAFFGNTAQVVAEADDDDEDKKKKRGS